MSYAMNYYVPTLYLLGRFGPNPTRTAATRLPCGGRKGSRSCGDERTGDMTPESPGFDPPVITVWEGP